MNIYDLGKKLAEEFKSRGQDVFVEIVKVDGEEVSVSVSYVPKPKIITNEDVWYKILAER